MYNFNLYSYCSTRSTKVAPFWRICFLTSATCLPAGRRSSLMFKISTRGDYGLLFLSGLAIAHREGQDFVSLKEIAKKKNLSLPYLSQIVMPLREAGFLESKEGKGGGYRLKKAPREITMMDVLQVLEGKVSPVRCCSNTAGKCGSESYCNVKSTWKDATHMLTQFLKKKTLEDIIQ